MSKRWQRLESDAADVLKGERVTEPWYLFNERPDVVVLLPEGRRMICDAKAYARFAHHTLLDTCQAKYCGAYDVPALVTKHAGQRGAYITLPLAFVGELLDVWRAAE